MDRNLIIQLSPSASEQACRDITATLPEWFGIPEANERYAKGVGERLSIGYRENGICIGLLTLEFPFPKTANIYWMGVKKEHHHRGIGQALLHHAESLCLEKDIHSLTVETLSPKEADINYLKTAEFYFKNHFKPLFELHTYGPEFAMIYLNKVLSPKIFKWIDLTHPITEKMPSWEKDCGFQHTTLLNYDECATECQFLVQKIQMPAGIGTHLDAPSHCFPNGQSIKEIPLNSLISPCIIIDVSDVADANYSVDMAAIEKFERDFGKINKSSFVIFYTGWDRFWSSPDKYHNNYQFPSITKHVAECLVSRDIAGIGIDTLSPDRPNSDFPVHNVLLGAGKYIVENIANAREMPSYGGYIFVMPIPIENGSEAPIRLLGMVPNQ